MVGMLAIFCLFIFLAVLVQISWFSLPFTLIPIFFWYRKFQFKNIEVLILFFAFLLSALANMSMVLISVTTLVSLGFFLILKKYFPSRVGVSLFIGGLTLIFWDLSLVFFGSLMSR